MQTVTIKGKEYELTEEPLHGVVRDIRKKQKKISVNFLMKYKKTLEELGENVSIQDAMVAIAEIDPDGMSDYNEKMEDFLEVSVVSLATGKVWVPEDFYELKESEYVSLLKTCREHIGSDATGFFGISTMSSPPIEKEQTENKTPDQPS
ncbi:MAG TPA: hypothetical protein PLN36_01370 [Bacteroidales bacterium]|nr:hypothetical protein [Bacteroidales bacterium]HRT38789.1 hypothetical protein [Rectinema sp.]HRU33971.1 hypothetical protein [Bacteroidales bacterium]